MRKGRMRRKAQNEEWKIMRHNNEGNRETDKVHSSAILFRNSKYKRKYIYLIFLFQKQDIMDNSLSIYGNNDGGGILSSSKMRCISPTDFVKRQKIS